MIIIKQKQSHLEIYFFLPVWECRYKKEKEKEKKREKRSSKSFRVWVAIHFAWLL